MVLILQNESNQILKLALNTIYTKTNFLEYENINFN